LAICPHCCGRRGALYSFPTRRSSDLNGVVSVGAEPVVVNLRCVATDVCTTPATVTIPANQNSIRLQVSGVGVGSTQLEATADGRSEEHTSELQSRENLVCRLLLEKKK